MKLFALSMLVLGMAAPGLGLASEKVFDKVTVSLTDTVQIELSGRILKYVVDFSDTRSINVLGLDDEQDEVCVETKDQVKCKFEGNLNLPYCDKTPDDYYEPYFCGKDKNLPFILTGIKVSAVFSKTESYQASIQIDYEDERFKDFDETGEMDFRIEHMTVKGDEPRFKNQAGADVVNYGNTCDSISHADRVTNSEIEFMIVDEVSCGSFDDYIYVIGVDTLYGKPVIFVKSQVYQVLD